MRRNMLAMGLIACGTAVTLLAPVPAAAQMHGGSEQSRQPMPAPAWSLQWGNLSDQFTIPLGPHWLDPIPGGFCGGSVSGSPAWAGQQ